MVGSYHEFKAYIVTHFWSGFELLQNRFSCWEIQPLCFDFSPVSYSCDFVTSINELSLSKQMITASAGLAGAVFGLIAEHAGLCFTSLIYQMNVFDIEWN